jgi:hypothetical protein
MKLIRDLIEDQHKNPVRIVAFNTAEGWSRLRAPELPKDERRREICARRDWFQTARQKLSAIPYDGGSVTMIRRMVGGQTLRLHERETESEA